MSDLNAITERLTQLEAENGALRRRLDELETPTDQAPRESLPVSRRTLLRRAGSNAIALGAVAAVGMPLATRAADGDPVVAGQDTASSTVTIVTSSAPRGLEGRTSASGAVGNIVPSGVVGVAFNAAGQNFSDAPCGVLGIASNGTGFNLGVQGVSSSPSGIGVVGRSLNTSDNAIGVYGESHGPNGAGVRGVATSIGVYATGTGAGSSGVSGDGHKYGVSGFCSDINGYGVAGTATFHGGRGGLFAGSAAQVRMLPSSASAHPSSGKPGDFFVDSAHRLWFCKGGTTWHRLA